MPQLATIKNSFVSNYSITETIVKAKRDFILSILKSTTTKREAKNYLTKYRNQFESTQHSYRQDSYYKSAESRNYGFTGCLHLSRSRSVNVQSKNAITSSNALLRVAIFEVPLNDKLQLSGLQETLSRLITLGVTPIVVLNTDEHRHEFTSSRLSDQLHSAQRLLDSSSTSRKCDILTIILRSCLSRNDLGICVDSLEQIVSPLQHGVVPLLLPWVYCSDTGCFESIRSSDLLLHLCRDLSRQTDILSIEKVIIIDELGGIPSIERGNTSHVFINLLQEYPDIISEMHVGHLSDSERRVHTRNLETVHDALSLIDKTAMTDLTGIITTPALLCANDDEINPIIYNVLTDRPTISSSLPSLSEKTPKISTSIIKKGFRVSVLEADSYYGKTLDLSSLQSRGFLDITKLFNLIEDAFGKILDRESYFRRIRDSVATIVILGDYEGAAIVTWETLRNGKRVPYLDKFAIAKIHQGAPNLADVIFKTADNSHPSGILWRSRVDNAVNKWYFERCRISHQVADSNWMLFHSGCKEDIHSSKSVTSGYDDELEAYCEVVLQIAPSFVGSKMSDVT